MKIWSEQQQAIFDNLSGGHGHTVVIARAGSGKTSTLVEGFNHVGLTESVLMCAFNKSVKDELEKRAPHGVKVHTLHSFGLLCIRDSFKKFVKVNKFKMDDLIKAVVGDSKETTDLRYSLRRCVALCKGNLASTPADVDEIIDEHQISPPETAAERGRYIQTVLTLMAMSLKDTSCVDFDDMVWMAVEHEGVTIQQFDRVFIDETQDLNTAQIQLALTACKEKGRICAVGDDKQAIYHFRGANSGAVTNVVNQLEAFTLPLTTTYRCGRRIVEEAQRYVPDFTAAPGAHEGAVYRSNTSEMLDQARPGDAIISRINAPLIGLCMRFIQEGRPANILGRDVGSKLLGIVKQSKAKTVAELIEYVNGWEAAEVQRLEGLGRATGGVEDTADCMRVLTVGNSTGDAVKMTITSLFEKYSDSRDRITLTTTHKAKGLEWERVWMLESTYLRPRKGKPQSPAQVEEEKNLAYVAITRAKQALYMVAGNLR